jgi:hypothetical protein
VFLEDNALRIDFYEPADWRNTPQVKKLCAELAKQLHAQLGEKAAKVKLIR